MILPGLRITTATLLPPRRISRGSSTAIRSSQSSRPCRLKRVTGVEVARPFLDLAGIFILGVIITPGSLYPAVAKLINVAQASEPLPSRVVLDDVLDPATGAPFSGFAEVVLCQNSALLK